MKVKLTVRPYKPMAPDWRITFLRDLEKWLRQNSGVADFEVVIDEGWPTMVFFAEEAAKL